MATHTINQPTIHWEQINSVLVTWGAAMGAGTPTGVGRVVSASSTPDLSTKVYGRGVTAPVILPSTQMLCTKSGLF